MSVFECVYLAVIVIVITLSPFMSHSTSQCLPFRLPPTMCVWHWWSVVASFPTQSCLLAINTNVFCFANRKISLFTKRSETKCRQFCVCVRTINTESETQCRAQKRGSQFDVSRAAAAMQIQQQKQKMSVWKSWLKIKRKKGELQLAHTLDFQGCSPQKVLS